VAIVIPYKPRPQFKPYHERTERYAKLVAHRRAGKTVCCINDKIKQALTNTRAFPPPRYSYIGPTLVQVKDVMWGYLKHYSAPIPGIKKHESELWIEYPNGARIRLYGAENYEGMRGGYNDGVTIDEPAEIDPRAWPEVIRPTLSDYRGWATFIGTPKGRNWFYHVDRKMVGGKPTDELDDDFFRLTLKASETGILDGHELEDAKKRLTPDQYEQEYECSFDAAILGAYYGKLMGAAEKDGRISGVPYEPTARVWTFWDLGIRDATAIWFAQVVGREIHLIDYYEMTGADLGHYVKELNTKPYVYAGHIVPHDAQAKELGTGKSRLEVMESLGMRNITVATMHRVEDGINAVRTILPRCWFDAKKCARGIDAMRLYRAEYDEKLQTLRPTPRHDWASHAADAFRYGAMMIDGTMDQGAFGRNIKYPPMGYA